jgi:hypothetical protein
MEINARRNSEGIVNGWFQSSGDHHRAAGMEISRKVVTFFTLGRHQINLAEETLMDETDKEACGCGCNKEHMGEHKGKHMGGHMRGHWGGKGPHGWDPDKLKEKLGLTEEQVEELKNLKEQKMELHRKYKEAKEKGDDEAIAKVKAQKEQLMKQMKDIFQKCCEGGKPHWAGKGPHGHGKGPHEWDADKLKEKFGITDEEAAEVKRLWKQIQDILKK